MNLKIGGNSVGKIMYGGQEFGGASKLEPGTILYISERAETGLKNIHLLNTTKNWSNIDGIHFQVRQDKSNINIIDARIYSDDFKSLDTGKKYDINSYYSITVSRSIIDGEYRLNASDSGIDRVFLIKAI
ncbi:hypothetical protein EGT49_03515 [Companilactobacillus suantsaicola]|uniref:Uncharacterized protein n=1 Tax=Companilactobacillus suantsaicola TaxID=2487723 RepID=A0A4Z0JMN1_9LACO|nr:hypothetical protein [Companilactobacillus suantsaicola]TGD24337.1 hypothetical protein EGT49_03515 [Companilactobacillus suantsaicola]